MKKAKTELRWLAANWGETKEAKMEYNRGREYRHGENVLEQDGAGRRSQM